MPKIRFTSKVINLLAQSGGVITPRVYEEMTRDPNPDVNCEKCGQRYLAHARCCPRCNEPNDRRRA
jgi:uncharacterized OB-fold protein